MKTTILLLFTLLISQTSFAVCEYRGAIMPEGSGATFYYVAWSADVGPAYKCDYLARTRTCENSEWSKNWPACQDEDSGGCVDWWVERMNDDAFTFTSCQD